MRPRLFGLRRYRPLLARPDADRLVVAGGLHRLAEVGVAVAVMHKVAVAMLQVLSGR